MWLHSKYIAGHSVHDKLTCLARWKLIAAQVAEEYGPEHYARGLARVSQYQRSCPEPASLTAPQMELVVQMAEGLADQWSPSRGALQTSLSLPDSSGIMQNSIALHFNDADWLVTEGMQLVHPKIPNYVAQQLGVQSLRYHHQVATLQHQLQAVSDTLSVIHCQA